ncbi:methyl-accepting chemotaxis protein [uncultured Ferrimonas sp.]|uniref:methyl-accepting chemotaxis protein n=1 Tax=uncultured Ferrimonas sp. TaxID=432640 RepID=UPI002609803B|nr:methyl-accepting chemotaxis protein [uncultured Ferrimonas sp.]
MREIAFRWIDQIFIKLTIREKFALLFGCFVTVLLVIGTSLLSAMHEQALLTSASADFWAPITTTVLIVFGLGLFVSGMMCYYLMTFVGGAMFSLNGALVKLADGDLTNRLNYFVVRDEFSQIAVTVDKVAEREQSLVQEMQSGAALLNEISSQLRQVSTESVSMTAEQATRLDSLASASEEMEHSIRDVANNATNSSASTQQAVDASQDGELKLEQTQQSLAALEDEVSDASSAVHQLEKNIIQINQVLGGINDISEQTNLLALNAAIEAARAGEQGRGFAVVADEVRTLAGRTQQATVSIQGMMDALQKDRTQLIDVMERTVERAKSSSQLMDHVRNEIQQVSGRNRGIADNSAEIAAATVQQSTVASSLVENITELRQNAGRVSQMMAETEANMGRLAQQSGQFEHLIKDLKA